MADDGSIEVQDGRRTPRHGIIWAEDWDAPRFRLLSPIQRCVYVTLVTYASGGRGEVWPKQATIAGVVGITLRATEKAIARLAELGYLRVTRQAGGTRRRNVYTLLSPPREVP